jgi:hypothetical protein
MHILEGGRKGDHTPTGWNTTNDQMKYHKYSIDCKRKKIAHDLHKQKEPEQAHARMHKG